jgi:hypothetical protein
VRHALLEVRVIDEHFVYRNAATVAGFSALLATNGATHLLHAKRALHPDSRRVALLGLIDCARMAKPPNEPLANDAPQCRSQRRAIEAEIHHALDCADRIVGVKR